jgi:hypothetical protein
VSYPYDKVKDIHQALARGYCTDRNSHKVLDPESIWDMAEEVQKLLDKRKKSEDRSTSDTK